jgi:DnaJ-class molecular chaperone
VSDIEAMLRAEVEVLREELAATREMLNRFTYVCPYCHGKGGVTGFSDIHGEMDMDCDYCKGIGRCNKAKDVPGR